MLEIDGSDHSGSGSIVRDSIPFCILTGQAIHLTNIRAKRGKPGLRPQHLKALEAAASLCGGKLTGGTEGSREIWFHPGRAIKGGSFTWDIEAGSDPTWTCDLLGPTRPAPGTWRPGTRCLLGIESTEQGYYGSGGL